LDVVAVGNDGNATILTVESADDVSATGNVISASETIRYEYRLANNDPISAATRIKRNDRLKQEVKINNIFLRTANCVVDFEELNTQTNQFFCDVIRIDGIFRDKGVVGSENPDPVIIRESDGARYKIINTSNVNIGVITTTNNFYPGNIVYAEKSGAEAILAGNFFRQNPASFRIESLNNVTLAQVPVSRVPIRDIADTVLSESDYEIQYANKQGDIIPITGAGFETPLSELGAFTFHSFGSIQQIAVVDPGSGYPTDPFFIVHEPNTVAFSRYDFVFQYLQPNRGFREGEIIFEVDREQNETGFKARIERHDVLNRTIFATRLTLDDELFNSQCFEKGNSIRGEFSNVSATLTFVNERRKRQPVGLNAKIRSTAFTGRGVATRLEIVNSGFGYQNFNPNIPSSAEVLRLVAEENPSKRIEAQGFLGRQGIAEGFHLNRNSFLSSDKYLQDSDFYQEYSYQVLTALPFNVYKKTLIDVFHVAGTKPFGLYVATSENEVNITPAAEFISVEKNNT
jgi:hypothetical protein